MGRCRGSPASAHRRRALELGNTGSKDVVDRPASVSPSPALAATGGVVLSLGGEDVSTPESSLARRVTLSRCSVLSHV